MSYLIELCGWKYVVDSFCRCRLFINRILLTGIVTELARLAQSQMLLRLLVVGVTSLVAAHIGASGAVPSRVPLTRESLASVVVACRLATTPPLHTTAMVDIRAT